LNYTRAAGLPAAETSIADPRAVNHVGSARRTADFSRLHPGGPGLATTPTTARTTRLLHCQRLAGEFGAECIEKRVTAGLHRTFLGSFSTKGTFRTGQGRHLLAD